MANKEMGHIPVAYPSVEEGVHSLGHLAQSVTGLDPIPKNQFAAHGWNAAGAGLSVVLPLDDEGLMKAENVCTPEECEQLKAFAGMQAAGIDREKWINALKLILPILLKLLICLIVCLSVSAAYAAPPQSVLEAPQDVLMVKLDKAKTCDCGCVEGLPCSCEACPVQDHYRWRRDSATGQRWRYLRPEEAPIPVFRPLIPVQMQMQICSSGG